LLLDGKKEFEFWWQLFLGVQSVGEVDTTDAAICMDLHTQGLNIVGTIGSSSKITQIELDLIPAVIKTHGHRADERFHSGS